MLCLCASDGKIGFWAKTTRDVQVHSRKLFQKKLAEHCKEKTHKLSYAIVLYLSKYSKIQSNFQQTLSQIYKAHEHTMCTTLSQPPKDHSGCYKLLIFLPPKLHSMICLHSPAAVWMLIATEGGQEWGAQGDEEDHEKGACSPDTTKLIKEWHWRTWWLWPVWHFLPGLSNFDCILRWIEISCPGPLD